MINFSDEATKNASESGLSPAYHAAARHVERYLASWTDDDATRIAELMKPALDKAYEEISKNFRNWLLSDEEYNAAQDMRAMVDKTVRALLRGEPWAVDEYITGYGWESARIREELSAMHADAIKDARIAELERDLKRAIEMGRR